MRSVWMPSPTRQERCQCGISTHCACHPQAGHCTTLTQLFHVTEAAGQTQVGGVQVAPCVPSLLARFLRALTVQQVEYGTSVEEIFRLFQHQGLPGAAGGDTVPCGVVAAMLRHLVPEATEGEAAAVAALADLSGTGAVTESDLLDTISTARAVRHHLVALTTCAVCCGHFCCRMDSEWA